MKTVLQTLSEGQGMGRLEPELCDDFVRSFDLDGDGRIDVDEFVAINRFLFMVSCLDGGLDTPANTPANKNTPSSERSAKASGQEKARPSERETRPERHAKGPVSLRDVLAQSQVVGPATCGDEAVNRHVQFASERPVRR